MEVVLYGVTGIRIFLLDHRPAARRPSCRYSLCRPPARSSRGPVFLRAPDLRRDGTRTATANWSCRSTAPPEDADDADEPGHPPRCARFSGMEHPASTERRAIRSHDPELPAHAGRPDRAGRAGRGGRRRRFQEIPLGERGLLHAFKKTGKAEGFPKFTGGWVFSLRRSAISTVTDARSRQCDPRGVPVRLAASEERARSDGCGSPSPMTR